MFSDQRDKKSPKSTQKILKFADANTNLQQLGKSTETNTRKHLPKCYLDPKLCKCKSKTGHFKVWNSLGDTQKLQKTKVMANNKDNDKKQKINKKLKFHKNVTTVKDEKKDIQTFGKKISFNKRKKIGDSCDVDDCKEALRYIQNVQSTKATKTRKKDEGFGDQTVKIDGNKANKKVTKTLKNVKNSYVNKKRASNSNPTMEIKVDSNKMQVLNPTEIKSIIQNLGTVKKNEVCICPSRKKRRNQNTCKDGACARAAKSKEGDFLCACVKKNVECNDSACVSQNSLSYCLHGNVIVNLLKKICSFKNIADNLPKHLFEVTLDSANMNVLNSAELRDIFKNASNREVCSTGVCRKGLEKNATVNCRCINKKLARQAVNCNAKTCNVKKMEEAERKRKKLKATFATHTRMFGRSTTSSRKGNKHRKGKRKGRRKNKKKIKIIGLRRDISLAENVKDCPENTKRDCKKAYKSEMKHYKKQEKKNRKTTRKALKAIERQKKREVGQWNCVSNLLNGIFNLIVQTIKIVATSIFTLITNPVRCYVYLKQKLKAPDKTRVSIMQWFKKTWSRKTTKVSKMVQDSEAISVISDHIENMPFYDSVFVSKGKTKEERALYERRKRLREKRMQKRHDEALYGCRNILLTTLRKTPCICFYYLCPNLYPQCLSLLNFLKSFYHLLIYLAALAFWTPCIFTFEVCRSLLCCLFCAG